MVGDEKKLVTRAFSSFSMMSAKALLVSYSGYKTFDFVVKG